MKRLLAVFPGACLVTLVPCFAGSTPPGSNDAVEIPAGTEIAIRTNETIDSRAAREGQTFSAVVDRDVARSSGETLIPKGSDASMILRRVSAGGTTGSPELTLDLESVTVHGRRYVVSTADVERR